MLTIGVDGDAVDVKIEVQPETPKRTIIMVVVNDREYSGYLEHDVFILTVER